MPADARTRQAVDAVTGEGEAPAPPAVAAVPLPQPPLSAPPRRCTGAILAGGLATRYGGRPKGLERVDGVRIIDRVAQALRSASDDILLVANDPDAGTWLPDVRTASDVRPGGGALAGIHAAIVRAGTPVLVVAWDMPFVPAALLRALRTLGEQGADAVVPESGSRRGVEPLCGYYTPTCVHAIERRLDAGDRRAIAFLDDVRTAHLDVLHVRQFGDPAHLFLNVNAPDDLARAECLTSGSLG